MAHVTETRQTWTVTLEADPADNWPVVPDQRAKTFNIVPETVTLTYTRLRDRRWSFEVMQLNGTRYRPTRDGSSPRGLGTNTYPAGTVPEQFHNLIDQQRYVAGLEPAR